MMIRYKSRARLCDAQKQIKLVNVGVVVPCLQRLTKRFVSRQPWRQPWLLAVVPNLSQSDHLTSHINNPSFFSNHVKGSTTTFLARGV